MTLILGFVAYAGIVWTVALCWLLRSSLKDIAELKAELARYEEPFAMPLDKCEAEIDDAPRENAEWSHPAGLYNLPIGYGKFGNARQRVNAARQIVIAKRVQEKMGCS